MVLQSLRDQGPQPRSELARGLDLSATTMTKVVAQLIQEGVVREVGAEAQPVRLGRPSTAVRIEPDAGLMSFPFDVTADGAEVVVARLAQRVPELIRQAGLDPAKLLGAGVGVPGPVDADQRRNILSINLGWRDVAFSDLLEPALGVPVVVDHNVRAMALAEAHYGQREDADPLMYVYVRTGVGAGVVMDGKPFRSGHYGVTELGHLRVIEKGRVCACGAIGCLETVASEPYLAEQVAALGADSDGVAPLAALATAAESGTAGAAAVLEDFVTHLATALASAVNLLNPGLIVLGGAFDDAPEQVFDQVRKALHDTAFPVLRDAVRIKRSTLGSNAGVVGGAAVALDHFFYA
jgi:predicted NBD/HSP70 family sugar kinase